MRVAHELFDLLASVQRRTWNRCFVQARPDGHESLIRPGEWVHRVAQVSSGGWISMIEELDDDGGRS